MRKINKSSIYYRENGKLLHTGKRFVRTTVATDTNKTAKIKMSARRIYGAVVL